MRERDNTELVKQAYERFRSGDITGMLELCTDDIEWELDRHEGVPFSGRRRGKEQVAEFFSTLDESQHPLSFKPREYIAQGDKVVALGHAAWSVRCTGRVFESDWAEIFTIRDGKIARFREFADSAAGGFLHG